MWNHAINEMKKSGKYIYGPESFLGYCAKHEITSKGTANHISIDYYEKLSKELKSEHLMVLRLGANEKKSGTNFILIKYNHPEDYFFFDKDLFDIPAINFTPDPAVRNALEILKLFNNYSEMMLVSYLLSSGVLSEVLGLDKSQIYYTPLTGRNVFTFDFYTYPGSELVVHQNGQVEIDAVFTGTRNGKPVIVVAEAKADSPKYASLAKHKLFYAYKSIQSILKEEYEIIPIYLKLGVVGNILTAKIAICKDVDGCLANFEVYNSRFINIDM